MKNSIGGSGAPDRHPEKRMKASYAKFEESRYEAVKADYPSLKVLIQLLIIYVIVRLLKVMIKIEFYQAHPN